jgi:hypothetical protein
MGLLDKLRDRLSGGQGTAAPYGAPQRPAAPGPRDPDEAAVERYRYMLRTAPPETIEQAHAEAFAQLTPEQRQRVLADVSQDLPPAERATSDDPQALARMATRAEMRQPGTMERSLGGGVGGGMGGRGMGMGGMIAGTLLASVAGAFIGSAIADAFLDDNPMPEDMAAPEEPPMEDPGFEDPGFDGGMDDFEF